MRAPMRRLAAGTALVIAIAGLAVIIGGRDGGHRFSVVVPAAENLLTGNELKAGGTSIGAVDEIAPVDGGRAARVTFRISDDRYWPLPTSSKVAFRFGGTVSFSSRYVLLTLGRDRSQMVPENGTLSPANVTVPVEVDSVINSFTPAVRRDLRSLMRSGAANITQVKPGVRRALRSAPPALRDASGLVGDLNRNQAALRTLLRSTTRVVDSVDRSSPGIRTLIDDAAQTFSAVASRASSVNTTLHQLPSSLRETRRTLREADVTLRAAGELTDTLKPGVAQLEQIAVPLDTTLAALRRVTPAARMTVQAVNRSAPTTRGIKALTSEIPRIGSIGKKATTQIGCLRPYTPEIVQFATTWGDWMSPVDDRDHLVRANVHNYLPAAFNSAPYTPADAAKLFPGLEYGFPRPPGQLAAQPWFQPQCGVGPEVLDPSKDQESATFKANRGKGG
ncbi:MAG: hypothetical protein H0V81_09785 [Solirubrobacterales bacterium]|nr:hypothetical protein [Solirubrobacterales bacterium]